MELKLYTEQFQRATVPAFFAQKFRHKSFIL